MKHKSLKLLLIEDSEDDAFFLLRNLKNSGFETHCKRITTAAELHSCLSDDVWDLIITDHTLPNLNSIDSINILNQLQIDTPLIVLSGTINHRVAVESMRLGARDFIMKDDTLRLIPAIERELRESEVLRKAQQLEKKHRRELTDFMYCSPAIIFIKDLRGLYTFINPQGEHFLHKKRELIIGKTNFDILPASQAEILSENDRIVIETKERLDIEEKIQLDGVVHIFQSIRYPLFDDEGNIYSICGILTDITEKKLQEQKLYQNQKMDAIGQLSGGIAHDFNNQLGVVTGYLEFLKGHFSEDKKASKWIEYANSAAFRCVDLTRQLLTFSRQKKVQKTVVDINSVFKDMSALIRRSVTPQIEVKFSLADDLWNTEIDSGGFQDVVLNLIINARDAMPNGGKLCVETCNRRIEDVINIQGFSLEQGEYIQLLISDDGTGMDEKTRQRIFEPFFTTKSIGKGTGLGLSMVYGFMNRYKGDVDVYSELGFGTTFRLYFPRSKEKSMEEEKTDVEVYLPKGQETILIVDDVVQLLELADSYLKQADYKTLLAETSAQALELLASDKSIDILFSDVVMPGNLNGFQLAESALTLRPELKVLMTSGFTSEAIEGNNFGHSFMPLLNKPYSRSELLVCIRNLIDED